jgi:hypothetical protein
MEKIKKAYYYLFYKFYKMSEAAPSRWLSDWKAAIVIGALEIWLLLSIGVYFSVCTKRVLALELSKPIIYVPLVTILILNYISFIHTDEWKDYVKEFDQLPKEKNRLGSWIVFAIVVFVLANLIFSFYLMSRIDWSQYR